MCGAPPPSTSRCSASRRSRCSLPGFGGAAFLRAGGSTNDHDLGIFEIGADARPSQAGHGQVGLYHLAWEVDTLGELQRTAQRLSEAGALVGASDHGTTKSLYAKDPDGIEFEVVWLIPAALLESCRSGVPQGHPPVGPRS